MKKIAISFYCLLLSATALANTPVAKTVSEAPKAAPAKWIFLLKSAHAQIKQIKPNRFQLIVRDLANTKTYMLNDRPFYLIRTIDNVGGSLWKSFAHSNYQPNKQVDATLILHNQAAEITLSHFQLHKDYVSYDIAATSKAQPLQPTQGSMELFISMNSRPLCNLMNQLRHDAMSKNPSGD